MPNPSIKTIATDFTMRLMKDQSVRDAMTAALTPHPDDPAKNNLDQNMATLITETLKLSDAFPVADVDLFRSEMQLLCKQLVTTESFLKNLPIATYWTSA